MLKFTVVVTSLLLFIVSQAQEASLPADLRQHSLTQYNASLVNPAFSLDRNNPQSVSFWTRWQWQNIDVDPTTLFLNYTRRGLTENSAVGLGFFQHNTGTYFNTGATANYAYQFEFNRLIKLSTGLNVFGFMQEIADTRFPVNPIPGIPQSNLTNDFILQVAPGLNLQVENLSLSLASENLIDFNFTDKEANTANSDKIFMGMASYDFPIMASDSTAYFRPAIYIRTIPEQQNQVGLNALFSTRRYWVQSGYNNFYGISVGGGGTVLGRFSIGAVVEFGTSASLNAKDPSFEFVASYFLGKPYSRRPIVESGINYNETQQVLLLTNELTNEEMRAKMMEAEKLANQEKEKITEIQEKIPHIQVVENSDTEAVQAIVAVNDEAEAKLSKKEAKKLAAKQKAILKQKHKDSILAIEKEQKALPLIKEQKEQKRQEESDAVASVETQRSEQQRKLESIIDARKAEAIAAQKSTNKIQNGLDKIKQKEAANQGDIVKERQRLEAIDIANEKREVAAVNLAEASKTSLETEQQVSEPEVVKPRAGEKYQEVSKEDGLVPGYYLIANVFGTKKYFDAFMVDLRNKGIQPKSFFRSANKYNYAYLERYATINEARQARDSKFNGKYNGKIWIFRVLGR